MNLKIKALKPEAIIPSHATAGSACFDLSYCGNVGIAVPPNDARLIPTGLAFEIPEGFVMNIYSRSGHGFKHGIRLANCVGKIDSDYRGEVVVALHNDFDDYFYVRPGDRIAQAELQPVVRVEFEQVDWIAETERGEKGFGSTGR